MAGINEATKMVTSYFDPGTKLIYAIGAVVGLIGGIKVYNKFSQTVRDLGISLEDARIQDLLLLWNKINRSASTVVIDHYSDYAKEEDIKIFDTRIYHSVKFARELAQGGVKGVFRSSYLPPVASLRTGTGVNEWVEEVCRRFNISTE